MELEASVQQSVRQAALNTGMTEEDVVKFGVHMLLVVERRGGWNCVKWMKEEGRFLVGTLPAGTDIRNGRLVLVRYRINGDAVEWTGLAQETHRGVGSESIWMDGTFERPGFYVFMGDKCWLGQDEDGLLLIKDADTGEVLYGGT